MKKLIALILAGLLCLSAFGCDKKQSKPNSPDGQNTPSVNIPTGCTVGDTANSELLSFTLDKADLTLACRYFTTQEFTSKNFENYLTPIEYDQVTPVVAEDGQTLIAFTFTLKNLDDKSQNYRGGDWYAVYQGKEYPLTQKSQKNITLSQSAVRKGDGNWEYNGPENAFLEPAQTYSFRVYGILPLAMEELTEAFELHIPLPTTGEDPLEVVYTINP